MGPYSSKCLGRFMALALKCYEDETASTFNVGSGERIREPIFNASESKLSQQIHTSHLGILRESPHHLSIPKETHTCPVAFRRWKRPC
ncbi:hypothetical protein Pint_35109 [Pistacia integerrima]|uniref:Uncharacterized protein n=1 Tax=Pistacia integerrima TaxID=434235 RepID=A0ACC0Y2V8_9ROSI|nr:hypothetical protein Pint_35109 [Pistacia integerrima]